MDGREDYREGEEGKGEERGQWNIALVVGGIDASAWKWSKSAYAERLTGGEVWR